MIKMTKLAATAAVALSISACSGNEAPEADKVTETQMDEVDVIDGTISDEMVDTDTIKSTDATGEEATDMTVDETEETSASETDSMEETAE